MNRIKSIYFDLADNRGLLIYSCFVEVVSHAFSTRRYRSPSNRKCKQARVEFQPLVPSFLSEYSPRKRPERRKGLVNGEKEFFLLTYIYYQLLKYTIFNQISRILFLRSNRR